MKQSEDSVFDDLPRLEAYAALLERYHASLDLVSDHALNTVQAKFRDALEYAACVADLAGPKRVLDVGSGAGLPGIVIALAVPHVEITLAERRRKRAAFLKLVCGSLGLDNVTVYGGDVRRLETAPFPILSAQAFGSFADIYCVTRHLHADTVSLLSRKGPSWRQEASELERRTGLSPTAEVRSELGSRGKLIHMRLAGAATCRF